MPLRRTKQWGIVRTLVSKAKSCPEVLAVFLKGSLAKGEDDEYSDIDFYCLVHETDLEDFLTKTRWDILHECGTVIFSTETNFVGPQVVAVFDDGTHVDLYAVTPNAFPRVGSFLSLHDPSGLLPPYKEQVTDHQLSWEQVKRAFDSFSFSLLEFEAAYRRSDVAWYVKLAHHLAGDLGLLLRHVYDRENGQLGTKRLEAALPQQVRQNLRNALALCGGEKTLEGVLALCHLMKIPLSKLKGGPKDFDSRLFDLMVARLSSFQGSNN